jgi:hypothetical protein
MKYVAALVTEDGQIIKAIVVEPDKYIHNLHNFFKLVLAAQETSQGVNLFPITEDDAE